MNEARPVAVVMGSDSDLGVMEAACSTLEEFGIAYHVDILSAHRTPRRMLEFAEQAAGAGFQVIIAGAGGAAHLPGMIAAATSLPVIGVPVSGSKLDGLDSLLSIVQMPRGVPVATVAINNARNAGLLAVRILALHDLGLSERLESFQKSESERVTAAGRRLAELGPSEYRGDVRS
ncbi:MAG: 5-(carboxyamino)imidazole ribonucleotide mutase [Spirochaetaceae bacterium]|nr:MAG: 5-(carboxyamino)imidazole ribonucleotide mutase [Spirochaetaceae bacterium]